ncbi:hypothetical protein INT45_007194 [Circinella minor]|uniref:Mediator complex subunit 16 n=1 Tax=Circinella minor TaxID=1195481 RepID=A0A8H7S5L9_9FUNG|nr:hypothetical protein INT45_007194 [Circinella minor]
MVVEMNPKKRRRVEPTTTSKTDSIARYPVKCILSNLLHRQAPQHICTSIHSVVITTPPKPNGPGIHALTGDHYTLDLPTTTTTDTNSSISPTSNNNTTLPGTITKANNNINNKTILNKTPIRLAEKYHDQHTITHLVWNQKGTTLASVDETGKLALWNLGNSSDNWSMAYSSDLHQSPAALLWLNTDRLYDIPLADQPQEKFIREPFIGPRNPYGYLALVVVTVHGEISVHFQQGDKIFSQFSSSLPHTGHMGLGRADIGCFGMNLANSGQWYRISHASLTFDNDGSLLLAAQQANTKPNVIHLYKIRIRFPGRVNEGAIHCQSITKLNLSARILQSSIGDFANGSFGVSQILLTRKYSSIELAVAFADSNSGNGYFGKWGLQHKTIKIPGDAIASENFSGTVMVSEQLCLDFISGFTIPDHFITCISNTRYGGLVLGLSDGSVHIEFRDDIYPGMARSQSNMGKVEQSIGPNFWKAGGPHKYNQSNDLDAVAGLTMSPNETHVICLLYSGRLAVMRVTNTDQENNNSGELSMISKLLKLTLLNQSDDLDLISELVRLSQLPNVKENTAEEIISNAMMTYQVFCNHNHVNDILISPQPDGLSGIRDWNLPQRGRAYGLALGTCRRLSSTNIQYVNLSKAIQLPVILECFIGSCKSDFTTITKVLDDLKISEEGQSLEFEADSLWSLISLTTWTLDFVRWILRKWNTLFNCKRPKNSKFADISARSSHAILLYHKESRLALCKILIMVNEFIRFTRSSSYELKRHPESTPLLQQYASNVLKNEPVTLQDMLAFLKALGDADDYDKEQQNCWDLLLHSRLPSDKIDKLRKITNDFAEKCAQPAIYLERDTDDMIDVIQKRRIPSTAKHVWCCVRCQQYAIPGINESDPCSYALWYRSLGRRCVCGGLFTSIPFRQSRSSFT